MATGSNNTIELTRLPNPTKHEKHQVETLETSLGHHKEIDKYSQNVDINTFRTYADSKQGFEDMVDQLEGLNKFGGIAQDQRKKLIADEEQEKDDNVIKGLRKGFSEMFREIRKPFIGLKDKVDETAAKLTMLNTGALETFQLGADQFSRGLKEMTNGIGAMGPAMNILKTSIFKVVAAWNMFMGLFRIVMSVLKGFIGAILHPIDTLKAAGSTLMEWGRGLKKGLFSWLGIEQEKDKPDEKDKATAEAIEEAEKKGPLGTKADPLYVISIKKAIEEQSKSKIWTPVSNDKDLSKKKEKQEEKLHKMKQKFSLKEHALRMKNIAKQALGATLALIPWLLIGGGLFLLWKKWDDWDPWAGLTTAAQKTISKITGIFTGLGETLAKKMPRLFGWMAPAAGEAAGEAAEKGAGLVDDAARVGTGAGDDIARVTGTNLLKGVKTVATKALGPAGAIAETTIDWKDNNAKFERIKAAYETGEKLALADESGNVTMRAITDEEWELIERAHTANRAGSVGKGAGSLAAAATAAAVLSPLLAGGPLGWGAYAIGVIGSAVVGGMTGDAAATNLVEGSEIDDAQGMVDGIFNALPEIEQGTDMSNLQTDIDDASSAAQTPGGTSTNMAINQDNSTNQSNNYGAKTDMKDKGLEYAMASAGPFTL